MAFVPKIWSYSAFHNSPPPLNQEQLWNLQRSFPLNDMTLQLMLLFEACLNWQHGAHANPLVGAAYVLSRFSLLKFQYSKKLKHFQNYTQLYVNISQEMKSVSLKWLDQQPFSLMPCFGYDEYSEEVDILQRPYDTWQLACWLSQYDGNMTHCV